MNILFFVSPQTLQYCAASIVSIYKTVLPASIASIRITILHNDGVSCEKIECFKKTLYDCPLCDNIHFINVSKYGDCDEASSLFRFLCPELYSFFSALLYSHKHLKKAIFLTPGVVIRYDLYELYDSELYGNCLGGIESFDSCAVKERLYLPSGAKCIDANILVWDFSHLEQALLIERMKALISDCLIYFLKNKKRDVLALLLHDKIEYLDQKWNVCADTACSKIQENISCDSCIINHDSSTHLQRTSRFAYCHDKAKRLCRMAVDAYRNLGIGTCFFLRVANKRDVLLAKYATTREDVAFSSEKLPKGKHVGMTVDRKHADAGEFRDCYRALFQSNDMTTIEENRDLDSVDMFFFHDFRPGRSAVRQNAILRHVVATGKDVFFIEVGFVCSVLNHSSNKAIPLKFRRYYSFMLDDMGFYFDSKASSRLRRFLASEESTIDDAMAERCRNIMSFIVDNQLTKYNFQPIDNAFTLDPARKRVLVVDQSRDDASVLRGAADTDTFKRMLEAAIDENPDAEIYIKTHPDSRNSAKGYYQTLPDSPNLHKITAFINPYSMLKHIDKVYVCSSQLGFEALMAGKKVVTFGNSIYAGWGLTDDRNSSVSRARVHTLEEVFFALYMKYTLYFDPYLPRQIEIESFLRQMVKLRSEYYQYVDSGC